MKKTNRLEDRFDEWGWVCFIASVIIFVIVFIYYETTLPNGGLLTDLKAVFYASFASIAFMFIVNIFLRLILFSKSFIRFLKEFYDFVKSLLIYCGI